MVGDDESEDRLAILIDADNTPYDALPVILDRSHKFGRAIIKRAYGDWSRSQLQPWAAIFKEFAIKAIHQPQFTTGKNSTDSAMLIDAMDILNGGRADVFMLVSSDSDFTGVASVADGTAAGTDVAVGQPRAAVRALRNPLIERGRFGRLWPSNCAEPFSLTHSHLREPELLFMWNLKTPP